MKQSFAYSRTRSQFGGLFTIEQQIEEEFSIKVAPDELESALASLSAKGLLKQVGIFYHKCSPLGDDDLSH